MTSDKVRIKKIELWQDFAQDQNASLHNIRIFLSNGESSKLFGAKVWKYKQKILEIRSSIHHIDLKADERSSKVYGLNFQDKFSGDIDRWELPSGNWFRRKIPDGETVIGVYGKVESFLECISSLGFITVKRN